MKSDIHPKYGYVVFNDLASGQKFLTRSTVSSDKTIEWEDGNTYPLAKVEISAFTHPFFTGQMKIVDTAPTEMPTMIASAGRRTFARANLTMQ